MFAEVDRNSIMNSRGPNPAPLEFQIYPIHPLLFITSVYGLTVCLVKSLSQIFVFYPISHLPFLLKVYGFSLPLLFL